MLFQILVYPNRRLGLCFPSSETDTIIHKKQHKKVSKNLRVHLLLVLSLGHKLHFLKRRISQNRLKHPDM